MNAKYRVLWAFGGMLAGALLATSAATAQTLASPDAAAMPMDTGAASNDAAAAKPKPKPKPKKAEPAKVDVVVSNMREVGLKELFVAISGSPDSKMVAGPLAPGKKVVVHLAHDKDCLFDLHGVYDDGTTTDVEGVALCKDKKINLVE